MKVQLWGSGYDSPPLGSEVLLIEVKANSGNPYMNFRKDARETLRAAAKQAGARAVLVHWAPRGERQELPEEVWP